MRVAVYALVFDKSRVLAFEKDSGLYSLPKTILRERETLADAAARSLKKEAGIIARQIQFVGIYDAPSREPAFREIATVVLARFWRREELLPDKAPELHWVENFNEASFVEDQNLILQEQGIFAPLSGRLVPFELVKASA